MIETFLTPEFITGTTFPIAVCGFLLWKDIKRDEKLEVAINNNTLVLKEVCTIMSTRKGDY